jgi:hypothetical protein
MWNVQFGVHHRFCREGDRICFGSLAKETRFVFPLFKSLNTFPHTGNNSEALI